MTFQKQIKIPAPNHTQVPNILLDQMHLFTPSQFKILMCISRYTFGFHKKTFALSISEFIKYTGFKKRDVIVDALEKLIEMKVIQKTGNEKDGTNIYKLIVHNSEEIESEVVTESDQGSHRRLPDLKKAPTTRTP